MAGALCFFYFDICSHPLQVRKARNRRQEWNVLAYDKEFRPDARLTPSPYHGMSSEGSLSPDSR